eukprot:Hpha_TRINITY_DN19534_c0_g1::TRINITY_DN19534_c0_g1_i1::g.33573::m.33573
MGRSAAEVRADDAVLSCLDRLEEVERLQESLNGAAKEAHVALVRARRHAEEEECRDFCSYCLPEDFRPECSLARGEGGVLQVRGPEGQGECWRWFTSAPSAPPGGLRQAQEAWREFFAVGCRLAAAKQSVLQLAREAESRRSDCAST